MTALVPMPRIVLLGRTPCLLVMLMVPCTWMIMGPIVSIAVSSSLVVRTTTVGPPTPPVVPLSPSAFTLAKPSAFPDGGGGEVLGVGDTEGEGDVDGDPEGDGEAGEAEGVGPVSEVTITSSKDALALKVATPICP